MEHYYLLLLILSNNTKFRWEERRESGKSLET